MRGEVRWEAGGGLCAAAWWRRTCTARSMMTASRCFTFSSCTRFRASIFSAVSAARACRSATRCCRFSSSAARRSAAAACAALRSSSSAASALSSSSSAAACRFFLSSWSFFAASARRFSSSAFFTRSRSSASAPLRADSSIARSCAAFRDSSCSRRRASRSCRLISYSATELRRGDAMYAACDACDSVSCSSASACRAASSLSCTYRARSSLTRLSRLPSAWSKRIRTISLGTPGALKSDSRTARSDSSVSPSERRARSSVGDDGRSPSTQSFDGAPFSVRGESVMYVIASCCDPGSGAADGRTGLFNARRKQQPLNFETT